MAGSARGPTALLALAGVALLLVCAAGIAAGLFFAQQLRALLPPVALVDAAAVGGATVALGVAAGLLGIAHVVLALALRHRVRRAGVPTIVLSATMSLVALGWAIAALVSSASGSGPLVIVLPAGIGLTLVAVGYGWATAVLIGLWRSDQPS